jgi:hypothetical protein
MISKKNQQRINRCMIQSENRLKIRNNATLPPCYICSTIGKTKL